MHKKTLFKQKISNSALASIVIVSSLIMILAATPIQNAYSINPTNPTNEITKGSYIQYF